MNEQTLVVKIGGSAGVNLQGALADLAEVARMRPLVVVHGVSERMVQLCAERGVPVEMLQSPSGHQSRYTPPAIRDLFVEAATQVNQDVVNGLSTHGIQAHGLVEQPIIHGERKRAVRALMNGRIRVIRDDHTGSITHVDPTSASSILQSGAVAVIPPLAMSEDGLLNIDGDRAAVAVASALGAGEVIILSNVRGLYRNFADADSFVSQVGHGQMDTAMDWAQGRMKRKVLSARDALESGVQRVVIGDGRISAPVTQALNGEGTVFVR